MAHIVAFISYLPDRTEYEARARSVPQHEIEEAILPEGFPIYLSSKMAWDRESISSYEDDYILNLDDSQLKEIDDALQHFKASQPCHFPLPSLHSVLRGVSDNIHKGTGFSLLRGIPVDRYSAEENMIIYVGVSSHIGRMRGHVVVTHITDMRPPSDPTLSVRIAGHTNEDIPFHTDSGDIVSLFALGEPAEGGDSQLASGRRVYNELARTRPDLIQVLASDWPIPRSKKEDPVLYRPLIHYQNCSGTPARLLINFSRRGLAGYGDLNRTRLLSVRQAEALDALHFLAESILHARRGYKDGPQQKRHLLRLWLRDPGNAWPTPKLLQHKLDAIYSKEQSPGPQVFPPYPYTTV
ncbi:hypothetical protein BDV30DRAFT_224967 [Aspergillus minisclerotigenes]|uniref:TauD/TfdA-like domain-containing protein n=1 Tax=Aspergillus minisclerotigenes TaxID=656917 RepID=A0A5N6J9I4_9EURO|nr:hypothetical protein BDV30DRAFT_224967 [Aspergillus minisclerotigenes]